MREETTSLSTADIATMDHDSHEEGARDMAGYGSNGSVDPDVSSVSDDASDVPDDAPTELFSSEVAERFRDDWQRIQTRFVDDPKAAVRDADHLVAETLQSLAETFTERKQELEEQWNGESEVVTEDLRLALRRYRSFFNQLLDA